MDNGTVFDYLKNIMTAPALPEGDMYEMVLDAMRQVRVRRPGRLGREDVKQ